MNNYVISLTSAQERRKHIEAEFGKQNIPFQFFDAITPDLIKEKAKAFNIDISNTNLTKGEIACALSHIALWHLAKQQNLDYICIFEDDIYLGNNAFELLKTNYIPEDTHIVKLETLPFDRINRFNKTEKYILNRKLFKLNSRHVGMAGYILTNKGAEFLINILKTLNIPIDDLIFDEYLKIKEYKVLQMSPALCVQDFILNSKTNFKSSLQDDRAIRCNNEDKIKNQAKLKKPNYFLTKIQKELYRPFKQLKQKVFTTYITFK